MISLVPTPVGGQQHDLRPPDMLLWRVAVRDQRLKPTAIGRRDLDDDIPVRMPQTRTRRAPPGIPLGIPTSDFIH